MLDEKIISKFDNIVNSIDLDEKQKLLYDITKSICFLEQYAESKGSHAIKLKDLSVSGISFFNDIVSDKTGAKEADDVRVMRILTNSLIILCAKVERGVFSFKSEYPVDDLYKYLTPASMEVIRYANIKCEGINSHFHGVYLDTADDYLPVLRLMEEYFVKSPNYDMLIETLLRYEDQFDDYFCFKNYYEIKNNIKGLVLPLSIRNKVKKVDSTNISFVINNEFNEYLSKNNFDIESYCRHCLKYLFSSSCQNIMYKLGRIVADNKVTFCTICIKLTRVLKDDQISYSINKNGNVYEGNQNLPKIYHDYMRLFFIPNMVLFTENFEFSQLDLLKEVIKVVKEGVKYNGT